MEWDDLKHFLAVARSGSLTEAARILKTSAATVGRRIAALESKLGARLFDRKQTGYSLTESGEAIRLRAEEVEEAVLSLEREALGRDLRPTGMRPTQGDFVIRRAGSWDFGLYAAKSYAETHNLKPELSDFSNADIITWTEEWAHLRGGPWFAKHAPNSNIALASDSRRVHQAACKAGVGVAILPCYLSDRDPDLIRLLPPERVLSVELWIVVHRDLIHTARVRAVMDFLTDVVSRYSQ
jgi:DNA-binding transcriptional LysR family regulator